MNRRAFLGWLTGTAAGVAAAPYLDLERLLWVPGAKTIVIPQRSPLLIFHKGDMFTIAGRYAMHPVTGQSTGHLQTFTVTADVTATDVPTSVIWPQFKDVWPRLHDEVTLVPAQALTPLRVSR